MVKKFGAGLLVDDELNEGGAMDIIINENNEIIILSQYMIMSLIRKSFLNALIQNGEVSMEETLCQAGRLSLDRCAGCL